MTTDPTPAQDETVDLDALRAVAEAATPGVWEWTPGARLSKESPHLGVVTHHTGQADYGMVVDSTWDGDARHIATFDPPTVLALIARVEQAEKEWVECFRARMRVETVMDSALGPDEDDGTGEGIAADVALIVAQRDDARAALAAAEERIAAGKRLADQWDDMPEQGGYAPEFAIILRDALGSDGA